jgi:transposase InsO family protein
VHAELRHRGVRVSRKRVARLMRQAGLSGLLVRRRGTTTIRVPGVRPAPDLVARDFNPPAPNRLWAADLTEVPTWEGKLYLAAVIDCYSRRCVGWAMAEHMRAELVVEALEMAVSQRKPERGLIHHSDQGSQGGFQRSSQHSITRSWDGQAAASVGSSRATGDAIAGTAVGRAARASSAVLGGDRSGRA